MLDLLYVQIMIDYKVSKGLIVITETDEGQIARSIFNGDEAEKG